MKPLAIALFMGLLTGCAELPLGDTARYMSERQSVDEKSGELINLSGQQSRGQVVKEVHYRQSDENLHVPLAITNTVFDVDDSVMVTPGQGISALLSSRQAYIQNVVAVNGIESIDPDIKFLPPVDDQEASNGPSTKSGNESTSNEVNIVANPTANETAILPGFFDPQEHPLRHNLWNDEVNFYRCGSLEWLAAGLGTSAILANTHIDAGFRDAYGEALRPDNTELDYLKQLGNGIYIIPGLAAIWFVDYEIDSYADENAPITSAWLQEWSGRSLRGIIVGTVPLLSLQYVIGSARPSYGDGSAWHPFKHDNGVSGHAFIGAVPLWTAAQMTDCCPLEVTFYAAGTLAGWSRIHSDAHYLSQVVMGWWLAGLSVSAVNHTDLAKHQWYVTPTVDEEGTGLALTHLW